MPELSAKEANTVPDYYKRLEPVIGEFGYTADRLDGQGTYIAARLSVYDDRADIGQRSPAIHVQMRTTGRAATGTVFHFKTLAKLDEFVNDIALIRDAIANSESDSEPMEVVVSDATEAEVLTLD
jgi:hypothetical protein